MMQQLALIATSATSATTTDPWALGPGELVLLIFGGGMTVTTIIILAFVIRASRAKARKSLVPAHETNRAG